MQPPRQLVGAPPRTEAAPVTVEHGEAAERWCEQLEHRLVLHGQSPPAQAAVCHASNDRLGGEQRSLRCLLVGQLTTISGRD